MNPILHPYGYDFGKCLFYDDGAFLSLWAIPTLKDNYIWAVVNTEAGTALIVDPAESAPVIRFAKALEIRVTDILVTHRHGDHTGGIGEMVQHFQTIHPNINIWGPKDCEGINHLLAPTPDGLSVRVMDIPFQVLPTPGHTHEHIVYINPAIMFVGDLIFRYGCGRAFDGTPAELCASIGRVAVACAAQKINPLLCAAHEYTHTNLQFCLRLLPNHLAWIADNERINTLRAKNLPTLPIRFSEESAHNPFLALAIIANTPYQSLFQHLDEAWLSALDSAIHKVYPLITHTPKEHQAYTDITDKLYSIQNGNQKEAEGTIKWMMSFVLLRHLRNHY